MDYKEKYEQALERAKLSRLQLLDIGEEATEIEYIFPELKESEDERIRIGIIKYLSFIRDKDGSYMPNNIPFDDMLAWLEKQGEQKEYTFKSIPRLLHMIEPSDKAKAYCQKLIDTLAKEGYNADAKIVKEVLNKWNDEDETMAVMDEQKPFDYENANIQQKDFAPKVEPKFKVGDWVVDKQGRVSQVIDVTADVYELYKLDNGILFGTYCDDYHLWTIQDAKDGDVLCTYECEEPKIVFILKGTPKKHYALSYYCYYNIMYTHFDDGNKPGCLAPKDSDVKPATKEQRDTLFKAMKEAGYEWDAEKKELKEIEDVNTIDEACNKCYIKEYSKGEYCHKQSFKWGFQEAVEWLKKQSKKH